MQQMRLRPMRRLPLAFGWLTIQGDGATRRWLDPVFSQPEIRRDAVRALRAVGADRDVLVDVGPCLARFDRPALVVWAEGDRVMPPEHGRRLAEALPQADHVEVEGTRTLIPLDQPVVLAGLLRAFLAEEDPG